VIEIGELFFVTSFAMFLCIITHLYFFFFKKKKIASNLWNYIVQIKSTACLYADNFAPNRVVDFTVWVLPYLNFSWDSLFIPLPTSYHLNCIFLGLAKN